MKRNLPFLFLAGILGFGLWILVEYRLWERISLFVNRPVFGKNWQNEVEKQTHLYPNLDFDLVFLGDSHMEQCEWQEIFPGWKVINRGIGGETTEGLLSRLSVLPPGNERQIFLQIGVNDALAGRKAEDILLSYEKILGQLNAKGYRVTPTLPFFVRYLPEANSELKKLNYALMENFRKRGVGYIDLNPLISKNQTLGLEFTPDGIHLNGKGYGIWRDEVKKRILTLASGSR